MCEDLVNVGKWEGLVLDKAENEASYDLDQLEDEVNLEEDKSFIDWLQLQKSFILLAEPLVLYKDDESDEQVCE